ncbi:MAG: hypothetical protein ACC654_04240 [Acidimicrobiia bacterium]
MKRIAGVAALLSLVAAACGQAGVLDGIGDRAESFVQGEVTTTSLVVPVAAGTGDEGVIGADNVLWFNDDIREQAVGTPEDVVREVWSRKLNSRFIQSSRTEIARALPALRFPSKVPSDVRWVTSQLVFEAETGTLDVETAAAFGLWTADPYQSDTSRLGVLRVGQAPVDVGSERSDIVPLLVPDGISLGWTESGHRYELFCRSTISTELCTDVAMSAELLSDLLP